MKLVDAPRLPKYPFVIGDLALALLAGLVYYNHPNPMAPLPLGIITGCFVIGIAASFIPFLVNYARDQEEANTALRRELGEQFKRLMAASEHLQQSTVLLKTIEEVATKHLQTAEKLPYRLQEKIAEFNQQLTEAGDEEREALEQELATLRSSEAERLATAADKIAKATAEWTKLEADVRARLAEAARLEQKLAGLLVALGPRIAALEGALPSSAPAASAPAPIAIPAPASPEPPRAEAAAEVNSASPPAPEPAASAMAGPPAEPKPARKPRAPRKPRTEETVAAAPAAADAAGVAGHPPAELIAEPVADETPAPENFSQVPPDEPKPAPGTDGRTRLTVVSYVGIGNKLYLRGEGPGLTWDKGVPLQFVSIGRWRWETGDATAPVTCKIYKNDKIEAPLGTITLPAGTEQEVTAAF